LNVARFGGKKLEGNMQVIKCTQDKAYTLKRADFENEAYMEGFLLHQSNILAFEENEDIYIKEEEIIEKILICAEDYRKLFCR